MYTVEDKDHRNSTIYDDCIYIGLIVLIEDQYRASRAGSDTEVIFADKEIAIEWLVAEHRDTPWADRSINARVPEPST